jgi:hypothetical protein
MTHWIRFSEEGTLGFGILNRGIIDVHQGNMFESTVATGRSVARETALIPGAIIVRGTSLGVGLMRNSSLTEVTVTVVGIGTLCDVFEGATKNMAENQS